MDWIVSSQNMSRSLNVLRSSLFSVNKIGLQTMYQMCLQYVLCKMAKTLIVSLDKCHVLVRMDLCTVLDTALVDVGSPWDIVPFF